MVGRTALDYLDAFNWHDQYAIDRGEIDAQHKYWLSLAMALVSIERPRTQKRLLTEALQALFDHRRGLSRRRGDTEMDENDIGTVIVDCAVELHQDLGPGLLETVYEVTLAHKLKARGLSVERQVAVAISYEGQQFKAFVPI